MQGDDFGERLEHLTGLFALCSEPDDLAHTLAGALHALNRKRLPEPIKADDAQALTNAIILAHAHAAASLPDDIDRAELNRGMQAAAFRVYWHTLTPAEQAELPTRKIDAFCHAIILRNSLNSSTIRTRLRQGSLPTHLAELAKLGLIDREAEDPAKEVRIASIQFGKVATMPGPIAFQFAYTLEHFCSIPKETRISADSAYHLHRSIVTAHARALRDFDREIDCHDLHAGMRAVAFCAAYWTMDDIDRARMQQQWQEAVCAIRILRNALYSSDLRTRLRENQEKRARGVVEELKAAANG